MWPAAAPLATGITLAGRLNKAKSYGSNMPFPHAGRAQAAMKNVANLHTHQQGDDTPCRATPAQCGSCTSTTGNTMPIRPRPITYHCPKCQWSKTIQPRSDALMPGDRVDTCPRCGHTDLEETTQNRPASLLEKIRAAFIHGPGKCRRPLQPVHSTLVFLDFPAPAWLLP